MPNAGWIAWHGSIYIEREGYLLNIHFQVNILALSRLGLDLSVTTRYVFVCRIVGWGTSLV